MYPFPWPVNTCCKASATQTMVPHESSFQHKHTDDTLWYRRSAVVIDTVLGKQTTQAMLANHDDCHKLRLPQLQLQHVIAATATSHRLAPLAQCRQCLSIVHILHTVLHTGDRVTLSAKILCGASWHPATSCNSLLQCMPKPGDTVSPF